MAEFTAIGEDPEKFNAFVNARLQKKKQSASLLARAPYPNELSSHEVTHL